MERTNPMDAQLRARFLQTKRQRTGQDSLTQERDRDEEPRPLTSGTLMRNVISVVAKRDIDRCNVIVDMLRTGRYLIAHQLPKQAQIKVLWVIRRMRQALNTDDVALKYSLRPILALSYLVQMRSDGFYQSEIPLT